PPPATLSPVPPRFVGAHCICRRCVSQRCTMPQLLRRLRGADRPLSRHPRGEDAYSTSIGLISPSPNVYTWTTRPSLSTIPSRPRTRWRTSRRSAQKPLVLRDVAPPPLW